MTAFLLLCGVSLSFAQLPPGGEPLTIAAPSQWRLTGTATAQPNTVEDMPFAEAVRIEVRTPGAVQLSIPVRGVIAKGDVLALEFFVRGSAARSEALTAYGRAWTPFYAGPQWRQEIQTRESDIDTAEYPLTLDLGTYAQTLDLGGLRIVNYRRTRDRKSIPPAAIPYSGMEADAPWRKAAAERIERVRKGDLLVRVTDAQGRPVPGAKVRAKMLRHAFSFGTAIRARELAAFDDRATDGYRFAVENYFNRAVFEKDLEWQAWETAKSNRDPEFRREWIDAANEWLGQRTLGTRGNYAVWGPIDDRGRGPGDDPESTLPQRILAHISEKYDALGANISEWAVLNHPVATWAPTLERRFGLDLYAEIFRRTREHLPATISTWVNESGAIEGSGRRAEFLRLLADLTAKGADITGVGFAGHFDPASVRGIEEMYADFDRFAQIVPNLQFTELDIDTTDEDFQARYLRDVLTIAFSHSNFCGILQWGFWEGLHWRPNAALWRKDWSLKPAGQAYLDLVYKQWWTDTEAETGADGLARIRGFLGAYEVSTPGASVTTQLVHDGSSVELQRP